jgi:hypothetical protein
VSKEEKLTEPTSTARVIRCAGLTFTGYSDSNCPNRTILWLAPEAPATPYR